MTALSRRERDKVAGDVRDKIMDAIAGGGDIPASTLLAIMLGVLDEIKDEIASLRGDIPGLREAVLNGHAAVHHDDHEWIAKMRVVEENREKHCSWCAQQYADAQDNKKSRRLIRDGLITDAIKVMGGVVFTLIVLGAATWWHDMPQPSQIREHVVAPTP